MLAIEVNDRFVLHDGSMLGFAREFDLPEDGTEYVQHIELCLSRTPLHIAGTTRPIMGV